MKKILALLLTVGMVLGLFAGCGNSNTTPAGMQHILQLDRNLFIA